MASIPLLCNICPKQRKFSDLSHLLTHVGSKGHLSHYFKLQVRGRQDSAARKQLATYDQWYDNYDVERLLSERLTLKESKKANAQGTHEKRIDPPRAKREDSTSTSCYSARRLHVNDTLDPELPGQHGKTEPPSFAATSFATTDSASEHKTHVPRVQLWSAFPERTHEVTNPSDTRSLQSMEPEKATPSDRDSVYNTPSIANRTSLYYPDPSTTPSLQDASIFDTRSSIVNRTVADPFGDPRLDAMSGMELDCDSTRLKGVFWPGMDIFDSATPEMKRKRNQKKDSSVLQQMMINSAEVEPTELIFTPEGRLKKSRFISGMVESSSPIKEESPKPRRRRSYTKKSALTEISGNHPRVTKNNRGARLGQMGKGSRGANHGSPSQRVGLLNSIPWNRQSEKRRYVPTEDEDVEWRLTFGELGRKKKPGFTIFADSNQPGSVEGAGNSASHFPAPNYQQPSYYGYGAHGTEHPHGLSTLNSEFHIHPASVSSNMGEPGTPQDQKNFSGSFGPSNHHQRGKFDKENIEPIAHRPGRFDHLINVPSTAKGGQQYFPVDGAHPTHFFQTLPRHTDYNGYQGPDTYGGFCNPLTYNFQQLQTQPDNNHPSSGSHPKAFTSPRRRTDKASGSEYPHRGHHNGAEAFDVNEEDQILFGEMMN